MYIWKVSVCNTFLGPNIFLNTIYSKLYFAHVLLPFFQFEKKMTKAIKGCLLGLVFSCHI